MLCGGVGAEVVNPPATAALQLPHLAAESLAEDVVNERVVGCGGLGKQAGQQHHHGLQGVAGVKDGPEAGGCIGSPGAQEPH